MICMGQLVLVEYCVCLCAMCEGDEWFWFYCAKEANFPFLSLLQGQLWKEGLDLLKLVVSNSASLVQPPTRGLPIVDLGLFNQTLPGPTLQFSVDLQPGSHDLSLAQEHVVVSSWKTPHASHRRTRERLQSVLNACVPTPVLISSPSVSNNLSKPPHLLPPPHPLNSSLSSPSPPGGFH